MKCVAVLQLLTSPFLHCESVWDFMAFSTLAQGCSQRQHHMSHQRPAQMGTEQWHNVQSTKGWHCGYQARPWQQEHVSVWVPQRGWWCCWAERGCLIIPNKTQQSPKPQGLSAHCHSGGEPMLHNVALGIRLSWDEIRLNLCLYFAMFNSD